MSTEFAFFDLGGDDQDDMERGPWYQARDGWMRKLLDDHGASPVAKVIGIRLAMMCNWNRKWCHPSYDGLTRMTGHARSSIKAAVHWLEDTGYIDIPQKGGTDKATGARWSNYYTLNFYVADEFPNGRDGSDNRYRDGSDNRYVISDNGERVATAPSLSPSGLSVASPPRENSAIINFPEFSNFLALARKYKKLGDAGHGEAGKERIHRAYTLALDRPGVTSELLYSRYETHLTERKDRKGKRSGNYVLKWLNNPWNYVPKTGTQNDNPAAASRNDRNSARESCRPEAKGGSMSDTEACAARTAIRDNPTAQRVWDFLDFGDPADTFRLIKQARQEYVADKMAEHFTINEIPEAMRRSISVTVEKLITDRLDLTGPLMSALPNASSSTEAARGHSWEEMVPLIETWDERMEAWEREMEEEDY